MLAIILFWERVVETPVFAEPMPSPMQRITCTSLFDIVLLVGVVLVHVHRLLQASCCSSCAC
jgi:hypothetical protein